MRESIQKFDMKLVLGMAASSKNMSDVSDMDSVCELVTVSFEVLIDTFILGLVVMMESHLVFIINLI